MRAGYFLLGGRGVCWRGPGVLRAVRWDVLLAPHSVPTLPRPTPWARRQPTRNTDQGVHHVREPLGGKPCGAMKVKPLRGRGDPVAQ